MGIKVLTPWLFYTGKKNCNGLWVFTYYQSTVPSSHGKCPAVMEPWLENGVAPSKIFWSLGWFQVSICEKKASWELNSRGRVLIFALFLGCTSDSVSCCSVHDFNLSLILILLTVTSRFLLPNFSMFCPDTGFLSSSFSKAWLHYPVTLVIAVTLTAQTFIGWSTAGMFNPPLVLLEEQGSSHNRPTFFFFFAHFLFLVFKSPSYRTKIYYFV